MVLIIGGAYQGKRDYAKAVFSVKEEEIYDCRGPQIDFSRRCINRVEEFVWDCVQQDRDAADYFRTHREEWKDSVLICQDLFCGVVPVNAGERQWRQETVLPRFLPGGELSTLSFAWRENTGKKRRQHRKEMR